MSKRTGNDGTVGDTIADADCKKEKGMAIRPFPYKNIQDKDYSP